MLADILVFFTCWNAAELFESICLFRLRFVEKFLSLIHVDDLVSEGDNINDAKIFLRKCKQWYLEGNFNLRNV